MCITPYTAITRTYHYVQCMTSSRTFIHMIIHTHQMFRLLQIYDMLPYIFVSIFVLLECASTYTFHIFLYYNYIAHSLFAIILTVDESVRNEESRVNLMSRNINISKNTPSYWNTFVLSSIKITKIPVTLYYQLVISKVMKKAKKKYLV